VSFPVCGGREEVRVPPLVITREEILAVYAQGPDAVVTLVLALVERITALETRVAALEAERAKDSHNSSKPPSSDATRTGRAPKSLRGKSGKPSGGQPGHPGTTLALRAMPDVVVVHAPALCAACRHAFAAADPPAVPVVGEQRQVFELPPRTLVCTEHQVHERRCGACGATSRGAFPATVRTTVQYGPGVLALGVALTVQHLLPVQRAADVVSGLIGQRVSPATLLAAEQRMAAVVGPVVAAIHRGLTQSAVVGFDETGFFVAAQRQWVHVACTPTLTLYTAHAKRGTGAHRAIGLLPSYAGTALHDGYESYFTYRGCRHALCGVHLVRELVFLAEEGAPQTRPWAAAFRRFFETLRRATARARAAGAAALDARTRRRYRRRYAALLARGEAAEPPPQPSWSRRGRPHRSAGGQFLHRLRRDQAAVLRFVDDLAVPFDNSEAERDLRMMKVEQKVSGGFRTLRGADTFCLLRSYVVTARKQGVAALDALRDALLGHPFLPAVP
jgi:transposase